MISKTLYAELDTCKSMYDPGDASFPHVGVVHETSCGNSRRNQFECGMSHIEVHNNEHNEWHIECCELIKAPLEPMCIGTMQLLDNNKIIIK